MGSSFGLLGLGCNELCTWLANSALVGFIGYWFLRFLLHSFISYIRSFLFLVVITITSFGVWWSQSSPCFMVRWLLQSSSRGPWCGRLLFLVSPGLGLGIGPGTLSSVLLGVDECTQWGYALGFLLPCCSICIVGARHIGSCGWLLRWSSVSLLWLLHCIVFCWVCSYTVKPVYNDHLMGYFSAFWSSTRWPMATEMSSRRQKLLAKVD